jgi:hypothetical protein
MTGSWEEGLLTILNRTCIMSPLRSLPRPPLPRKNNQTM